MKKLLLAFILYIGFPGINYADDFQTWVPINTNVQFDKNWRGFLEIHPRIGNDSSQLSTAIVRPAVGYAIDKHSTFWVGYLMQSNQVGNDWDYNIENRVWQGYTWKDNITPNNIFEIRNRMEERFLSHNDDISYRWRTRARLEHLLSVKNWSVVASEEFFITLNNNVNDAQLSAGMNQNRAYLGVAYRFAPEFQVESGYLHQHVWGYADKEDQNNNIWVTNININY